MGEETALSPLEIEILRVAISPDYFGPYRERLIGYSRRTDRFNFYKTGDVVLESGLISVWDIMSKDSLTEKVNRLSVREYQFLVSLYEQAVAHASATYSSIASDVMLTGIDNVKHTAMRARKKLGVSNNTQLSVFAYFAAVCFPENPRITAKKGLVFCSLSSI